MEILKIIILSWLSLFLILFWIYFLIKDHVDLEGYFNLENITIWLWVISLSSLWLLLCYFSSISRDFQVWMDNNAKKFREHTYNVINWTEYDEKYQYMIDKQTNDIYNKFIFESYGSN